MNVVIKPKRQRFVESNVKSGRFSTVKDLVDYALAKLEEEERGAEQLRQEIRAAVARLDRGERYIWDVEAQKTKLLKRMKAERRSSRS